MNKAEFKTFLSAVPKAELHLHLEAVITLSGIKKLYKNVTMKKALVMTGRTAQNNRKEAEKQVDEWLKK